MDNYRLDDCGGKERHCLDLDLKEYEQMKSGFVSGQVVVEDIPRTVRLGHFPRVGNVSTTVFPEGSAPRSAIHYEFGIHDSGLDKMLTNRGLVVELEGMRFKFSVKKF
ncbi:MAG: hypothetical protein AABX11_03080 [Nanoarchaeota archaeon]